MSYTYRRRNPLETNYKNDKMKQHVIKSDDSCYNNSLALHENKHTQLKRKQDQIQVLTALRRNKDADEPNWKRVTDQTNLKEVAGIHEARRRPYIIYLFYLVLLIKMMMILKKS